MEASGETRPSFWESWKKTQTETPPTQFTKVQTKETPVLAVVPNELP